MISLCILDRSYVHTMFDGVVERPLMKQCHFVSWGSLKLPSPKAPVNQHHRWRLAPQARTFGSLLSWSGFATDSALSSDFIGLSLSVELNAGSEPSWRSKFLSREKVTLDLSFVSHIVAFLSKEHMNVSYEIYEILCIGFCDDWARNE